MLRWLGQACFLIASAHGTPVLIDPPNPMVGYAIAAHSVPAKAVFVSHEHPDHNWTDAAEGAPQIIAPMTMPAPAIHGVLSSPGDTPPQIAYTRIFAYHDPVQGKERGPDTITVMTVDHVRVCHLGDLGQLRLSPDQLAAIGRVDVLMIPVGGFFTIDASQAAAIVDQLQPRMVIPMHYGTPRLNPDLRAKLHPVDEFVALMKARGARVVQVTSRDLRLSAGKLPQKLEVDVLRYQ